MEERFTQKSWTQSGERPWKIFFFIVKKKKAEKALKAISTKKEGGWSRQLGWIISRQRLGGLRYGKGAKIAGRSQGKDFGMK